MKTKAKGSHHAERVKARCGRRGTRGKTGGQLLPAEPEDSIGPTSPMAGEAQTEQAGPRPVLSQRNPVTFLGMKSRQNKVCTV